MFITIGYNSVFDVTDNFTASEIYAGSHPDNDKGNIRIDKRVVEVAEYIRVATNQVTNVNSAFRNLIFNLSLGSNDSSQHPKGTALDLSSSVIVEFMRNAYETKNHHWQNMLDLGLRGLGLYDWGVHIDVRNTESVAFWDFSKKKV